MLLSLLRDAASRRPSRQRPDALLPPLQRQDTTPGRPPRTPPRRPPRRQQSRAPSSQARPAPSSPDAAPCAPPAPRDGPLHAKRASRPAPCRDSAHRADRSTRPSAAIRAIEPTRAEPPHTRPFLPSRVMELSLRPLLPPHVHPPLRSTPLMAMKHPDDLCSPSLYKVPAEPSPSPCSSSLSLLAPPSLSQCSSPEFTAVRRRSSTTPSQSAPPSVETHRSSCSPSAFPRRSSIRAARRSRPFPCPLNPARRHSSYAGTKTQGLRQPRNIYFLNHVLNLL